MTLYLQDPDVDLHLGDALEVLQGLPDESVHCVATSPPFFGLRDYGTGRWEGGDEGCDHTPPKREHGTYYNGQGQSYKSSNTNWDAPHKAFGQSCGKCGARRVDQQIGLEASPDEWASRLVAVFREARRVLRADGSLWVECGDSYNANVGAGFNANKRIGQQDTRVKSGTKPKDLIGQPFLLAFALRADGWYWRGCYIWAKPNAMPESAKDRCTVAHSYVLHFSKSARYFFDGEAVREENDAVHMRWLGGRRDLHSRKGEGQSGLKQGAYIPAHDENGMQAIGRHPRSVWTIPTQGFPEAHFATWPEALARRIILAACPEWVCSVCGKARERIVERRTVERHELPRDDPRFRPSRYDDGKNGAGIYAGPGQRYAESETVGFTDCGHNAYRPGVVLDPFAGSGTTCHVARKLGRRSIGIDLNEEYLEMAARRLQQQSLFADGVT